MGAEVVKDWLWAFAQQSLDYAILLVDLDKQILWAGPGAAWTLAATSSEIVGSQINRFFTPEDRAFGIPEQEALVARTEGASLDDRWMLRADGSPFWASGRTVGLNRRDGQPLGYLKIFRDRTEWQMRVGAVENQANAVLAEHHARAHAVGTILLELDDALAAAREALCELRRTAVDAPATSCDTMERHLGSATGLVEALNRSMQAEPATALEFESLLLPEELQAALSAALQRRPRGQRRIQLLLPPGLPISFEGDRHGIRKMFAILLDNALEATADDGRIAIIGTVEGGDVLVRFEDDGAGIPAQVLETIFGMFTNAVSKSAAHAPGTGLALVKRLVQQHGGSAQARSAGPGKGSEFSVRLPTRQPSRRSSAG